MSLAIELHNNHKAIHQRIAAAAEALEARKRQQAETAQVEVLEAPEPEPEPVVSHKHKEPWFSIVSVTKLTPRGAPSIRSIQRAACDAYDVKMNDLLSARRTWNVVLPRQVSMYLAKELTLLSYPQIGRATGGRDHSTSIHAHRKIERLLKSDDRLSAKVAQIREIIG